MSSVKSTDMNLSLQHHRSHAGASFTKARACVSCVQMRQISVKYWTTKTDGTGNSA